MLTQEAKTHTHTKTCTHTHTLLHPPGDAILITSPRFNLSPLDQMADVFIQEGEEMKPTAQRRCTGRGGRVFCRMMKVSVCQLIKLLVNQAGCCEF